MISPLRLFEGARRREVTHSTHGVSDRTRAAAPPRSYQRSLGGYELMSSLESTHQSIAAHQSAAALVAFGGCGATQD